MREVYTDRLHPYAKKKGIIIHIYLGNYLHIVVLERPRSNTGTRHRRKCSRRPCRYFQRLAMPGSISSSRNQNFLCIVVYLFSISYLANDVERVLEPDSLFRRLPV
jgi:hypothetical protein